MEDLTKYNRSREIQNDSEPTNEEEQILADKPANLLRDFVSIGGRIKVTNTKLIFKSHIFNFEKITEEIPLNNIESVHKKNTLGIIPNRMLIKLKSGVEYNFVVTGRNQLILLIENNR